MLKLLRIQTYVMSAAVVLGCCLAIGAKPSNLLDPPQAPEPEANAQKKKQKQMALLKDAKRASSDGSYKEASSTIAGVLGDADDPDVIKEADEILTHNKPNLLDKLGLSTKTVFTIATWWVNIVFGLVALIVLYLLLKLARFIWSKAHSGKWRVGSIEDSTNLFLADAIVESLNSLSSSKWSPEVQPVTSGLLRLERLQLPYRKLEVNKTQFDLSTALSGINLQFGGISLSGIAGAGQGIRGWFNATRPSINGKAIQSGSELLVRLNSREPNGRPHTVSASVSCAAAAPPVSGAVSMSALGLTTATFSAENIRSVAEAASYQIFYLISKKGSTEIEAQAANKLHEGLNLLGQSLYGQNPKQLGDAYEAFRLARTQCEHLFEAYLYEGITLDLLQQHDEAIARFKHLEDQERVSVNLREKAAYNRAISLSRKYKYPEAQEAEKVLNGLIANSEIKSMARAAKASVISQYPMYWRDRPSNSDQPLDVDIAIKNRKAREPELLELFAEVTSDKDQLECELAELKRGQSTDKKARQQNDGEDVQLEWAIKNAWGNLHLNSAMYFYAEPYADDWKDKHEEYLRIAYGAFQECAMLITPGVEILTNLAKVSLGLGRVQQGCNYLEQAIKLNPHYEYAYYRLALVREERNEVPQLVSVLKRCEENVTPAIAGFTEIFHKYEAQLHPPAKPNETPK